MNNTTIEKLADTLSAMSEVLRELAVQPVPTSPESAAVGQENPQYAGIGKLMQMFDFSRSGIYPYLVQGEREGKIRVLKPQLQEFGRNGDKKYRISDVESYLKGAAIAEVEAYLKRNQPTTK